MVTKEVALEMGVWDKENEINTPRKEIERLEKYEQYDKTTAETKVIMDNFVRTGFTENWALDMVKTISSVIFGGMK